MSTNPEDFQLNLEQTIQEQTANIYQEQEDKQRDQLLQFKRDMRKMSSESFESVLFLKWLMLRCGYQSASVVQNQQSGDINPLSLAFHEGQRNVWLAIRQLMPQNILAEIENPEEQINHE